jgi:hypothetical protein
MAWAILLFGIFTALAMVYIVYETYTPVIFWDQWTIVNDLIKSHGHPSWSQIWSQHNEHRIPFGRLACYADLLLFKGKNVSLIVEIFIVQILQTFLLIWMFRRYGGLGKAATITAAGFFTFCAFYPIQIENFNWGWSITYVLAMPSATLALAALVVHVELISSEDHHAWFSWALVLSLLGGIVAELSLANGVFVWPVLLLLGFMLKTPRMAQYVTALVGVCTTGLFVWGFHHPDNAADPLQSLLHPVEVARYMRTYLAWTWDTSVPNASPWPTVVESLTTLAIVFVPFELVRLVRRRSSSDRLEMFLFANILFALISSTVTALGRINFGIQQATSSRYQTIALVFWGCSVGILLIWRAGTSSPPANLVHIQVVLLLVLVASGSRFSESGKTSQTHQASLAQAYMALIRNPSNVSTEVSRQLSPYPNLAEAYEYLRSHNMGPDSREFGIFEGSMAPISAAASALLTVTGFRMLPSSQCTGYMDAVNQVANKSDTVMVSGWAWDVASAKRPARVIFARQDGSIAGAAEASIPRSDVRATVAQVTALETGWRGEAFLPPGATLRTFVMLDDSRSVCPLLNEFRRQ